MPHFPEKEHKQKTLVVTGGGAAGFFCAVNAARMNSSIQVILLEKTGKLLSKVSVSGGGRCNVTHAIFDITEMSNRYPRGRNFVKKTFHQFFTKDTIEWFESRGVKIKKEADGRMFPVSDSSQSIIRCLINEAGLYGVDIRMHAEVQKISRKEEKYVLELNNGNLLEADYVVIACGGYPKTSMFQWLLDTGHTIIPPVPSLFTFNLPKHPISRLMGITVENARIKIEGTKLIEEGPVLITHWGLSGPAVLKLSAWGARQLAELNYEFRIHINWLPHIPENDIRQMTASARIEHPSKKIYNHQFTGLPLRLYHFLLEHSGVPESWRFADLTARSENMLVRNLTDYVADVKGKTTFKEEFVTAGGISLNEVDASTMMSKKMNNLYFAGEILDVDGITGGFNFQHAWTSAYIAARHIASSG